MRKAQRASLGVVQIRATAAGNGDGGGRQAAILAGQEPHLGAAAEKLGAATLVVFHMRSLVAQDGVVRPAHGGQPKGIGGRTGEEEENLAVLIERFADEITGAGCPGIVSIPGSVPAVGLRQGRPSLRAKPGVVVTGELAGAAGCLAWH